MRSVFCLVFFVGILLCQAAVAEPSISGNWVQGGLLQGKTNPANKVFLLDREVDVSDKGHFVFGLGRDTAKQIELVVTNPAGEKQSYQYAVKQRNYATQKIEGVEQKYVAPPPEVSQRIKREAAKVWQARQQVTESFEYTLGFDWPAEGPVTGVYGSQRVFNGVPKRPHYGLDIAGPVGTKVIAPAAGRVSLTDDNMYYSGGTLIVDHGYGVSSTFIHLSKILVEEGDYVDRGQPIAEIGATGRVTGPHLDWRINWFDQRLDPELLLPPKNTPK